VFHVIYRLVASRDSFLTILLPSILYFLAYQYVGLMSAVVVTSLYGLLTLLFRKELGMIALAFALSGFVELTIAAFVPREILVEAVVLKLAMGSLSTASVFLVFSWFKKPIPMLVAEITTPALKGSRESTGIPSLITWQRVNGIWVFSYLCKSVFLLSVDSVSESELVGYTLALGWPLHVGLIVVSVWVVNNSYKQACHKRAANKS
jgi:hypothetical protein